jgi:hypothetical protein
MIWYQIGLINQCLVHEMDVQSRTFSSDLFRQPHCSFVIYIKLIDYYLCIKTTGAVGNVCPQITTICYTANYIPFYIRVYRLLVFSARNRSSDIWLFASLHLMLFTSIPLAYSMRYNILYETTEAVLLWVFSLVRCDGPRWGWISWMSSGSMFVLA